MELCHTCYKPKKNLTKCEGCYQDTCEDCCVELTVHNMIDFAFCKTCESASGAKDDL